MKPSAPHPTAFNRDGVVIVGDLWIDQSLKSARAPFEGIDFSNAELVILAGDIANALFLSMASALRAVESVIDLSKVYVIPGERDYLGHALNEDDRFARNVRGLGANWAQKRVIIKGTKRYLCCTLWAAFKIQVTDPVQVNLTMSMLYRELKLFKMFENNTLRQATLSDVQLLHKDHLNWLRSELAKPFDGDTIVVTHHAPCFDALAEGTPLPLLYASDLSALAREYAPFEWNFGHTLRPSDFIKDGVRYRNVSLTVDDDWID